MDEMFLEAAKEKSQVKAKERRESKCSSDNSCGCPGKKCHRKLCDLQLFPSVRVLSNNCEAKKTFDTLPALHQAPTSLQLMRRAFVNMKPESLEEAVQWKEGGSNANRALRPVFSQKGTVSPFSHEKVPFQRMQCGKLSVATMYRERRKSTCAF